MVATLVLKVLKCERAQKVEQAFDLRKSRAIKPIKHQASTIYDYHSNGQVSKHEEFSTKTISDRKITLQVAQALSTFALRTESRSRLSGLVRSNAKDGHYKLFAAGQKATASFTDAHPSAWLHCASSPSGPIQRPRYLVMFTRKLL